MRKELRNPAIWHESQMPDWAGFNLGQILYGAKLQSNAGVGGMRDAVLELTGT